MERRNRSDHEPTVIVFSPESSFNQTVNDSYLLLALTSKKPQAEEIRPHPSDTFCRHDIAGVSHKISRSSWEIEFLIWDRDKSGTIEIGFSLYSPFHSLPYVQDAGSVKVCYLTIFISNILWVYYISSQQITLFTGILWKHMHGYSEK